MGQGKGIYTPVTLLKDKFKRKEEKKKLTFIIIYYPMDSFSFSSLYIPKPLFAEFALSIFILSPRLLLGFVVFLPSYFLYLYAFMISEI